MPDRETRGFRLGHHADVPQMLYATAEEPFILVKIEEEAGPDSLVVVLDCYSKAEAVKRVKAWLAFNDMETDNLRFTTDWPDASEFFVIK